MFIHYDPIKTMSDAMTYNVFGKTQWAENLFIITFKKFYIQNTLFLASLQATIRCDEAMLFQMKGECNFNFQQHDQIVNPIEYSSKINWKIYRYFVIRWNAFRFYFLKRISAIAYMFYFMTKLYNLLSKLLKTLPVLCNSLKCNYFLSIFQ